QPADHQVTQRHEQAGGVQPGAVELLRARRGGGGVAGHRADQALDVSGRAGQRGTLQLEPAVALLPGREAGDLGQQRPQRAALVAEDLAEEQVQALDRGGALVQAVDLGVPDVLLDRVVLEETGPAEGLQRQGEHLVGALRANPLDYRQQQVVERLRLRIRPGTGRLDLDVSWTDAAYSTKARMPSA